MPGRILVVDDDFPIREICVDFLAEEGYEVESAASGKDGLGLLAQKTFHILLSDIQMPGMTGTELLKETRRLHPEMEVILMTAFGGLPSAIEAVRFGA